MSFQPARARLGSRGKPEESRAAILQAAIREFAREGVAGARTDAIAKAAKVNKALLYYYFRDKDALYGAALEQVFQERDACEKDDANLWLPFQQSTAQCEIRLSKAPELEDHGVGQRPDGIEAFIDRVAQCVGTFDS